MSAGAKGMFIGALDPGDRWGLFGDRTRPMSWAWWAADVVARTIPGVGSAERVERRSPVVAGRAASSTRPPTSSAVGAVGCVRERGGPRFAAPPYPHRASPVTGVARSRSTCRSWSQTRLRRAGVGPAADAPDRERRGRDADPAPRYAMERSERV